MYGFTRRNVTAGGTPAPGGTSRGGMESTGARPSSSAGEERSADRRDEPTGDEDDQPPAKRARKAIRAVNANVDLESLCKEFPAQLGDLAARGGGRLPK